MHVQAPGSVTFEGNEPGRIERFQVSIILGIEPERVDKMPPEDRWGVLTFFNANREIEAWQARRGRRGR